MSYEGNSPSSKGKTFLFSPPLLSPSSSLLFFFLVSFLPSWIFKRERKRISPLFYPFWGQRRPKVKREEKKKRMKAKKDGGRFLLSLTRTHTQFLPPEKSLERLSFLLKIFIFSLFFCSTFIPTFIFLFCFTSWKLKDPRAFTCKKARALAK